MEKFFKLHRIDGYGIGLGFEELDAVALGKLQALCSNKIGK